MFTVKLLRLPTEGPTYQKSISCEAYDVYTVPLEGGDEAITITTYAKLLGDVGVEHHIGGSRDGVFDVCYVENQAGKTIDRFSFDRRGMS